MSKNNQRYQDFLAEFGFQRDELSRVWLPETKTAFEYSDGDEVEDRIAAAIAAANDLSLFSAQLASQQTDWPSIYHLSPSRANLLRPLAPILERREILEIGAGCGAISRYLGELGAEVLALEGSYRRAATAASRCRDLGNVTVVNQNLEQFPVGRRFDVVTLIGVLEYARKYSSEQDGIAATLRRARSLLKDDGILLVAIENQLGLKYFAGMHEDHLGRAMAGIQDHYAADGVVTFGRRELREKILSAGFAECEFALPFPDYKLPSNVVLPAGWSDIDKQDFDAATLAGQATRTDRQLTHPLLFSTCQAFTVAQRNGLLADFSNSFLVLARATSAAPGFDNAAPGVLACHYSAERAACYATSSTIRRDDDGATVVVRTRLVENPPLPKSRLLSQRLTSEPYTIGRLWADELDLILSRPSWTIQDVSAWMASWLQALEEHTPGSLPPDTQTLQHEVPGSLIDAIPRNLVRAGDGHWVFFDQEWTLHVPISLGYLAFRALFLSLQSVTCVAEPSDLSLLHVPTLVRTCLRQLGFIVTASDVLDYLDFEAAVQSEALGHFVRPQSLAEYETWALAPSPNLTALLHAPNNRLSGEILARLSSQQIELETARQSVETLNADIANAGMHVKVLEAKVGEETTAKHVALAALATARQELDAKLQHMGGLESELARIQEHELQRRDSEIEGLRSHIVSLEVHIGAQDEEKARLLGELHAYADLARPLAELEQLRTSLQEHQFELGQLRADLRGREADLATSNARLIEQTARLADISSQLSSSAATTAALHVQLAAERDAAKRSAEEAAIQRSDLATAAMSIADKDNEIHRLWALIDLQKRDGVAAEELMHQLQLSKSEARESQRIQVALSTELASIKASTSWRLTSPLRAAKAQWTGLLHKSASKAGTAARYVYRGVPIPMHRKIAMKNALFDRFPQLSRTNAYRRWQADVATHAAGETAYSPIAVEASSITGQLAYAELPTLYTADGVAEWRDYHEVKARIVGEASTKNVNISPKPVKILDFTSSNLAKIATGIELPVAPETPDISIVIPAYNHAARTLECVASIAACRDADGPTFEIIVADDASTEPSAQLLANVANLRFVRQDSNLGFLRNCNAAVDHARGKAILFLNNDVQVTSGWLTTLWSCLISDTQIGAVGPKIIYPSGWLQDAGTRLRRDGTAEMIGLNELPDTAAYSYDRDVDYCSGACLLVRHDDFVGVGGFDERFTPAYCEDSDLCMQLREQGKRIVFCAGAEVVHHLSATSDSLPSDYKLSCITRNLDTFSEKWRCQLDEMDSVRTIAFYLPQFHPFPENDLWWGDGFTEWTNVTKARPNYVGHYQPRVPADLGYYDLRIPEVMNKQAELARRYGIGGFCFYYYWFAGHRLLERPIERMLATEEPDFPFCLCWANENWTRRWDGQEHDVLIAQKHSDEDDLAVIEDLARYFRSKNYIRVNGKPLLLVYRVTLFPNFARTSSLWRRYCSENGIGEIYIAQVESFELVTAGIRPEDLGCDAAVEFPPQGMAEPRQPSGQLLNGNFVGAVADYHDLAVRYATRELPPYKRFMGVMPGWDNTARRQNNSYSFERSSPGAFQAWLETAVKRTKQQYCGDERLVFINAWNEWAEGAYLEPDRRFGHSFLQAHLNALETENLVERKTAFPG